MDPPEGRRLGIFGGTFDPPHVGHVVVASDVRHAARLDSVLLVVANDPWQKTPLRVISPARDRLDMARASVEGLTGVEASGLEIRRGGPSYTFDTVDELISRGGVDEVVLIVGTDAAAGLDTWHRADELRSRVEVIVVDRPGHPPSVPPGWRWDRVAGPNLAISSTMLRTRVAEGRPIDGLTPPGVVTIVRERRLYCGGGDDGRS